MAQLVLATLVLSTFTAAADTAVVLKPRDVVGESTRVVSTLVASGQFKQVAVNGEPAPKPLALKVETRLEFVDKTLAVGADGSSTRAVRRVEKAGAAINGEVRVSSSVVRPEESLLVAEMRNGQIVVVSPGGPLLRSELELVQGPADPLAFNALLPLAGMAKGQFWTVGSDAARSLSGYDQLDDNSLRATLESLDEASAVVSLKGAVRGSALGGQGTINISGSFTFNRVAARVESLEVERTEVRQPGPVEAGLDVKSTLSVTRKATDTPPELSDSALKDIPLEIKPDRELLMFKSTDGKYTLVHDRDWHIYWDSDRQTVFKRLVKGQTVAHCNLTAGPNAGVGRHQDPAQLRDDIKKAAGQRFVKILGEGEVDGPPESGYRYKVAVQGREGEVGVIWYYYLMAGPRGDQVLAVFTLSVDAMQAFADQDLRMIGTFEWVGPTAKP